MGVISLLRNAYRAYKKMKEETSEECIRCMNRNAVNFGIWTVVIIGLISMVSKTFALVVTGAALAIFSVIAFVSTDCEEEDLRDLERILACNCKSLLYMRIFLTIYVLFLLALFLILWEG